MSRLLAVASLADAGLCNPSGRSCVRDCMQFLIAQMGANPVPELEQHGGICHLMLAEKELVASPDKGLCHLMPLPSGP